MFSGLIEAVGTVRVVEPIPSGSRIEVGGPLVAQLAEGDSVAVNGVCLTVVAVTTESFTAEISPETARVTTLGRLRVGVGVNLERPLKVDDRVGGHFVLGHVDGAGEVVAVEVEADFHRLGVSFPAPLRPLIVPKGSIAVEGISLTIAALTDQRFDVQIVPYTWEHTTLPTVKVGDALNLECDIIGKYVLNAVAAREGAPQDGAPGSMPTET